MREYVVENEFVKAIRKAGGVAYKLTSQTANGLPDRLVLFFPAKTVFVELKAPGKMLRPLQRKRRLQLMALGFPVLCIDHVTQIKPAIEAILTWRPGEPFPEGIGAQVPELEVSTLPSNPGVRVIHGGVKTDSHGMPDGGGTGDLTDMTDYGETLEPIDPADLAGFFDLDADTDPADASRDSADASTDPGCYCYTCEAGHANGCPHAAGRHYDPWGEGISSPDYCPFRPGDPEGDLPF